MILDEALENNISQIYIFTSWLCYLSFFRGFTSFFAGYISTVLPISLSLLILLIPPLIIIIPAKYDSDFHLLFAILFWMGGVLVDLIWFKLVFLMVGFSLTFLSLRQGFKLYNTQNIKWLPFIFAFDLLLRSPNRGQDFFVHSNLLSKVIGISLAIFTIFILYKYRSDIEPISSEIFQSNKRRSLEQLGLTLAFFMIIAVYSVELAGPGILVVNNLTHQSFAIIISVVMFIVVSYYIQYQSERIKFVHGFIGGIVLSFSIYFYPWYNFTIVLWVAAIISTQMLFLLTINNFRVISSKQRSIFLILGHYAIIFVLLIGLLTESYLLMPIISIFIGLMFLIPKFSVVDRTIKFRTNFTKFQIKLIPIFIVFLLLTTFIPLNSTNNPLEPNSGIRIMSYNLHFGISEDGQDNGQGVVNLIKKVNPTIIAFQEVTFAASLNGYKNMYSFLESELDLLGYRYSYFSEGGKYQTRNVLFSKLRMSISKTSIISPRVVYERNVIESKVTGENFEFMIYATHLTHIEETKSNLDRVKQARHVIEIINSHSLLIPSILLGDFNAEPDWEEIDVITAHLNDSWGESNGISEGFTWPNESPRQRIDYIFHNSLITLNDCSTMSSSASDHRPIVCNFNN